MTRPFENKTPKMVAVIESLFPGTSKLVSENKCPMCKQAITEFRDALSQKEYGISGMCQRCQDMVFGGNE